LIAGLIDPGNVKQLLLATSGKKEVTWTDFKAQAIKLVQQKLITDGPSGDKLLYGQQVDKGKRPPIPTDQICTNKECVDNNRIHPKDRCWIAKPELMPNRMKKRLGITPNNHNSNPKPKNSQRKGRKPEDNCCNNCGQYGHYPVNCPQKPSSQRLQMKRKGGPAGADDGKNPAKSVNFIDTDGVEYEFMGMVMETFEICLPAMCLNMTADSGYSYWIFDSACPVQICNDLSCYNSNLLDSDYRLRVADKRAYESGGLGTAACIRDAQYFPHFGANLISQTYCRDTGWSIHYDQVQDEYKLKAPYMDGFIYFKRTGKYYVAKLANSFKANANGGQTDNSDITCLATTLVQKNPSISTSEVLSDITEADQQAVLSKLNLNFFWANGSAIAEVARTLNKAELRFIVLHQQMGHINYTTLKMAIQRGYIKDFPYSWKHIDLSKLPACDACLLTKMTLASFRKQLIPNAPKITFVGELIHTDVKGPFRTKSINGEYYWILFVDDFSGMVWIYFLKAKSDALVHGVQRFNSEVMLPKGFTHFRMRLDNGGEYFSEESKAYCYTNHITPEPIAAHHPQMNGTVERMNRTILFMERPMRKYSGLPPNTWTKSSRHAVYLKCRLPRAGRPSPHFYWFGEHPSMKFYLMYGQPGTRYIHENNSGTMADTGEPVQFVGYDDHSKKSFHVYRKRDRRILITPDVEFPPTALRIVSQLSTPTHDDGEVLDNSAIEDILMTKDEAASFEKLAVPIEAKGDRLSSKAPIALTPHESSTHMPLSDHPNPVVNSATTSDQRMKLRQRVNVSDSSRDKESIGHPPNQGHVPNQSVAPVVPPAVPRRGTRTPQPIERLVFLMTLCCNAFTPDVTPPTVHDDYTPPSYTDRLYDLLGDTTYMLFAEPTTFKHATEGPEKALWILAIKNEYDGLSEMGTWDSVPKPDGAKLLKTKWVFKVKRVEGRETIYRARLVVKGYTQIEGVDYNEIFSPVVRHSTVRLVLAICAHYGLFTRHLDAPKAFVQADIDTDIYMSFPQGFKHKKAGYCLKLKKSLYGLKQASRLFNELVTDFLLSIGFIQCMSDTCLFYFFTDDGSICIICVYVDDLLLCSTTEAMGDIITRKLEERFNVKDLGAFSHILGMEVTISEDRHTIELGHIQYITDMLVKYNMDVLNSNPIPMNAEFKLFKPTDEPDDDEIQYMANFPYREMIGSLMYLMICCRPDLSVCVTACAKFCSNPRRIHADAIRQIFQYLVGTTKLGITYTKQTDVGPPILSGYCDTDWASQDLDLRKSYLGYVFFMSGGPISWKGLKEIGLQQLSSTSTEYVGQSEASREGLNLRNTYQEVLTQTLTEAEHSNPTVIKADNTGAIKLASNPIAHARHKHTSLKFHFVRELVKRNLIRFEWISTDENIADIMTKPLSKVQFRKLRYTLMGSTFVYPELIKKRRLGQQV
jgi:transposase InsO family protein